jgi:hypothetical protein
MGEYSLLSGTSVYSFDGCSYYPALDVDKKLRQITVEAFARE